MTRKQIITLICCFTFCTLILVMLYASSSMDVEYRGGFQRTISPNIQIENIGDIDLIYNSYYIAGTFGDNLYLGDWTAPQIMLVVNQTKLDTQTVNLTIDHPTIKYADNRFTVKVDSPYFYLANGALPAILRGTIGEWKATHFMPDSGYFDIATPIGPSSFALRSYSIEAKQCDLVKETAQAPLFEFKPELLEKQIDGLICVDGALHKNPRNPNQLAYVYHYRNQYVLMDSNLNLVNRGRTIDTIRRAKIKVTKIDKSDSNKKSILSSPPMRINGISSLHGDYLFIQSGIMADNDKTEEFTRNTSIDVYNIKNYRYIGSFHVPDYEKQKPSAFKVVNNKLFLITGKHLLIYNLDIKENLDKD